MDATGAGERPAACVTFHWKVCKSRTTEKTSYLLFCMTFLASHLSHLPRWKNEDKTMPPQLVIGPVCQATIKDRAYAAAKILSY